MLWMLESVDQAAQMSKTVKSKGPETFHLMMQLHVVLNTDE